MMDYEGVCEICDQRKMVHDRQVDEHNVLRVCDECDKKNSTHANVHPVIAEAMERTGTNWTLDGLSIEGGFDVREDGEEERFWDVGMFAFGSKTAASVEGDPPNNGEICQMCGSAEVIDQPGGEALCVDCGYSMPAGRPKRQAAFGDAPFSGVCEHCGAILESADEGLVDENGNIECPVADYHSIDINAGSGDEYPFGVPIPEGTQLCPECGSGKTAVEDGRFVCNACGWEATPDEDEFFERARDRSRGASVDLNEPICDSCGQANYNSLGVCPLCGYSDEGEPEMGPWNSSVDEKVACPVCRNAVHFASVNDEFAQCPKCDSVISYSRVIASSPSAADHVQVIAKRPSGWFSVLAELTDPDLVEAASMMWERDSDPRYANVSQVMGEIEVEIGRRRLALDDYPDDTDWAEVDRQHYVVDTFGDIKSGPYPDFYTAHTVARYDREIRLAVPADMIEDFEFRVV